MLRLPAILSIAITWMGLGAIAHAQTTTSTDGADVLKDIRNKPAQQVFFDSSKRKITIPSGSTEERSTWTKTLSKDWVVESRKNSSLSTVAPQDIFRENSDLRVLFQQETANP